MMKYIAVVLLSWCACQSSALKLKEPGFDGFGTPDPFNRNDDDEVDAGEPNAPEDHDSSDDANMVTEEQANAEDDDSFLQLGVKREPGFDGFGTPDPFNRNDDDEVDAGEPNAPEDHDSSDDANMVTEEQANAEDDDSFLQLRVKKEPGFDGFGTPDPFNRNDDDEVDAGEPNAPEDHDSSDDANMVTEEQANAEDDDSFLQMDTGLGKRAGPEAFMKAAQQLRKKYSAQKPQAFVQVATKRSKREPGFDGFGTPDPFNRNDDDEVDAGEPNAPEDHDSSDDANMVTEEQANAEDDDSFMQIDTGLGKTVGPEAFMKVAHKLQKKGTAFKH